MEAHIIAALKAKLIAYARFVEDMIERSVKGFLDGRPDTLGEIVKNDEERANRLEVELDEECTALIAQYEPRGRELRTVLMALGITSDLERMADHAVNIAEAAGTLSGKTVAAPPEDVARMASAVTRMVDESITSFVSEDPALAASVCRNDDSVDDLAAAILTEMSTSMGSAPSLVDQSLVVLKVAGNLERIADLSTNICEDVIYMTEGRVIKHHAS